MSKRWYVVHAYSGFEKSVMRAIQERITRLVCKKIWSDSGSGRRSCRNEEWSKGYFRAQVFPGYVL
jgi:transcriptional antiterminator NusG